MLKTLERNPFITWFLIFAYMILIFYLSSIPYPVQPKFLEKIEAAPILEHIIEFTILGFLLVLGFKSLGFKNFLLLAIVFGILYGITDEIHQFFVPGRDACFMDVFINSLGVLVGVLLFKLK